MSTLTAALPRARRFPLLVGTRSYRLLATLPSWLLLASALALLLTVTAADLPIRALGIAGQVLSLFALVLCISPVALLAQWQWVWRHTRDAIACRACDVELGRDSVRVLGGPWHGFHANLADLVGERAILLEKGQFCLRPARGKALIIDFPDDPDERASLDALAASLKATVLARASGNSAAPQAPVTTDRAGLEVLRCSTCGAPLTPSSNAVARCAYCSAETPVPAELVRRLESSALVDARQRTDEALCVALRAQPGPALANVLAFCGGALSILLTAVATFLAAMMAFLFDDLGGPPHFAGIALAECGLGLLFLSLVRSTLANRTALRVLTLGFSALPSNHEGAGDLCRNCGAPLPESASARVLVRCVYCGADNLGSLDLGQEAAVVQRFSAGDLSPTRALAQVRRRRLRGRLQALVGGALLCAGIVWHLESPRQIAADAYTVTLPVVAPAPDPALAAGPGALELVEEATVPDTVLSILPNGADVDLVVRHDVDEPRRLHTPHGQLQPDDLLGTEHVPRGSQYAARSGSDSLLIAGPSRLICVQPNAPPKILYGSGLLADTIIEDPESSAGCAGLVTTRAGAGGHFRVRQVDATGTHTILVDAHQPALAPNGRMLVVSQLAPMKGVFELVLLVPGSAPRLLTHGPIHAGYATWSPDGRKLAFLSVPVQDPIQFSQYTGSTQLFVLDLQGHLLQLTVGGQPDLVRPTWTAHGIFIVKSVGDTAHPETKLFRAIPR
jgi:hypothetical protein